MLKHEVKVGDVLEIAADVLISPANPWLNMSGGVNGQIFSCCPEIQEELRRYLESISQSAVPAGAVVKTLAGVLPFSHIIHAVAIDPFYDSSIEIVSNVLKRAFEMATHLEAKSISLPPLATGYGPLTKKEFAMAFKSIVTDFDRLEKVTIVVQATEDVADIKDVLFVRK